MDFFEIITTISSIILLLAAVAISLITYHSQKIHNRNSVKPLLNIIFGDYEYDIHIKTQNNGVGPAIIKEILCSNNKDKTNSLIELIPNEFQIKNHGIVKLQNFVDFVENIEERVIAPNKEIIIIKYEPEYDSELVAIRTILKDISIKIRYVDIYQKEQPVRFRDCSWFGRTL